MRLRRAIALILLVMLAASTAQAAICQEPGENLENALTIKLIPGEITVPESGNYILNSTRSQHFFRLEGLKAGQRLIIELEAMGMEQGRAIISLYKGSGELIAQRKIQYGSGTREKMKMAYQPSLESAPPDSIHHLALSWYSGSLGYRLHLALETVEDYEPGMGDAGSSPDSAIRLPDLSPNNPIELKGYLASIDDGGDFADHVDYYLLSVKFNNSKSTLKMRVKPLEDMRVSASLYMEDRRLAYGSSGEPGGEISLDTPGEWRLDERYNFIIRIDNLADRRGGAYIIRAWVEGSNATEQHATAVEPPGGLDERALMLMVVAGAASLIAISIIMIFLRRRRIYRVEEVGWWGY